MSVRTLAALLICLPALPTRAGEPLIELEAGGRSFVGKALAHDDRICWLVEPDGRLQRVPLDDVTSFRKVSNTFRPLSVVDLRSALREEFGRDLEVTARGSHVVAGPAGKTAGYAELLDEVRRSFVSFFSRRDFRLAQPEFPLVVIVFPDVRDFVDYCRRDGVRFSPLLRGYYHPDSNRIALYDPGNGLARDEEVSTGRVALPHGSPLNEVSSPHVVATIQADLRDTLVHEATHQLAFNMGLHTRIGENPRWVVEGLAMLFERQALQRTTGSLESRLNEGQLGWYRERLRPEWSPGTLQELIADDRLFAARPLDAYSLAWALTFYLSERRSVDFADYLKTIRDQDVSLRQTPSRRLGAFQQAFGDDIAWLEVQMLRYLDDLP